MLMVYSDLLTYIVYSEERNEFFFPEYFSNVRVYARKPVGYREFVLCAPWFFFFYYLNSNSFIYGNASSTSPEEVNKRGEKSRSARESELLFGEK